MKKNRLWTIFQFIIIMFVLTILMAIIYVFLELFEIIKVPEKYSLLKYLPTNVEVSINEYSNHVENNTKGNYNNISIKKTSEENSNLVDILDNIQKVENNKTNKDSVEKYYYSLLNNYGKIIYDKILSDSEQLKTGTYNFQFEDTFSELLEKENGNNVLENAFQSALNAFIYDNPEIFYIDIGKMYLYTETKTIFMKKRYNVYIGPEKGGNYYNDNFDSKSEIDIAINEINQIVEDIKYNLTGNDKYSQIKYVHDYLIDTIVYDRTISKPNIYNIYGALINKETVCEGYTKAFKYILNEIGIENIFVFGVGINKEGQRENHSWNYVKLENEWYGVDVTWDDPIIIGGSLTSKYKYRYFLKGSNTLFKDHVEDARITENVEFYYPTICENDYNY